MRATLLGFVLITIACTEPSPRDELLAVKAVPDAVVLKNRSNDYVPVMIMESTFMAGANWVFCYGTVTDPAQSSALPPHGSLNIPRSKINNYSPGATAVVLHARLVRDPDSGSFACDSIRALSVTLR